MSEVKLICGNCLQVMPTLTEQVDAIITDLPYGTTACSWDVIIPFEPMWEQVKRINKGVFVTTASQPFTSKIICSNLSQFKYEWILEKSKATGYAMSKLRPMKAHENIVVFYEGVYNPQMEIGKPYKQPRKNQNYDNTMNGAFKIRQKDYVFLDNDGVRFPRSVIKFRNSYYDDGKQVHPTQKPVALYEYLIRTYTNEGDTVLDFTMGSGTTGVACVQTGRNFIGVEIDPDYFKIAQRRIHDAQQQMILPFTSPPVERPHFSDVNGVVDAQPQICQCDDDQAEGGEVEDAGQEFAPGISIQQDEQVRA